MTSDPSSYPREYSPYASYSLFPFEGSDVISVLKNSIEYSFVFFKCLLIAQLIIALFLKLAVHPGDFNNQYLLFDLCLLGRPFKKHVFIKGTNKG